MAKVKLGFFSFTEVTDPAEHRSYNEWHMFDHMPEQYPLDGIVYGQRWVSTPACRAARAVSDAELGPVHYLTLYLLADPIERTLREFMELGRELHEAGRFHAHRRARLSGPLERVDTAVAPRVLISAEAVPYRPNRGVYVVVESEPASDAAGTAYTEWLDAEHVPALLALPGVAGVWSFAGAPEVGRYRWTTPGTRITVVWLDDDPLGTVAALDAADAARRARAGAVTATRFAGPFESITPWQWQWFDAGGSDR